MTQFFLASTVDGLTEQYFALMDEADALSSEVQKLREETDTRLKQIKARLEEINDLALIVYRARRAHQRDDISD